MAAYPQDPFKQADSLLSGLVDSYRGATDAQDIADIQSLVETTVKIARDREYRIHSDVRELSLKVTQAEAAAIYSDARTRHERNMGEINKAVSDVQQDVQQVNADIKSTNDQQAEVQLKQKQLLADKEELEQLQQVVEPDKLKRISLHAHISGVAFEYSTLDDPVTQATVSDSINADIRSVSIDHHPPHFEAVNKLWDQIACPEVQ